MARDNQKAQGVALAVIGCGKLGTAILQGVLRSIDLKDDATESQDVYRLSRLIASVRQTQEVQLLNNLMPSMARDGHDLLEIIIADNVEAVRRADVVILTCHPAQASECLQLPGIQTALAGKLLVSMLGGVSAAELEEILYADPETPIPDQPRCHIVQASANITAASRRSMTVVVSDSAITGDVWKLCENVLGRFGSVAHVPASQMSVATALCASCTAFYAQFLSAIIEGAVTEGYNEREATQLAAVTMAGAAYQIASGDHPAALSAKVATPGGVTADGLRVLSENGVNSSITNAFKITCSRLSTTGGKLE